MSGIISAIPIVGKYMPGKLLDWGNNLLTGSDTSYWWALGITIAAMGCAYISPSGSSRTGIVDLSRV